ncbi:MAG: M48 family metallopeptidase [Endomicrobium sp.]|jgi:heat shock protein HtpX|nr:M48 family metallopeptidase [Endomicrobium sp.]
MANITTYDFIGSNTRKTILLMILFPISLVVLVYLMILLFSALSGGAQSAYGHVSPLQAANALAIDVLPVISVIAILWITISYFFGQKFILSAAGAVEINKQSAPEIIRLVENIAITAGLPMPKVYVINDESLNAFATGRDPKHSYIALTKGIIKKLEKPELEGVIAHEMAHIGNRDIRLMLIMVVCISFATIAAEMMLRFAMSSKSRGSGKNKGGGQLLLVALALALYIYGYLIAPLIKLAVSRTREYQADATAALLTRNPEGLVNALRKISKDSVVEKLNDKETMAAMCIATPLSPKKQNSLFSKFSGLFATHPPIEDRIKALMTMDGYRS